GRLVTVLADGRDARAVHSVSDGFPYRNVVERRHRQVDEHGDVCDGREPVMVVRALGGVKGLDVWDELGAKLGDPGGQFLVGGVVGGKGGVLDRLDLGQARLPVVGVGGVGDVLAAALAHHVGAGPDGSCVGVGHSVFDR